MLINYLSAFFFQGKATWEFRLHAPLDGKIERFPPQDNALI
jgi:hypothetical protein